MTPRLDPAPKHTCGTWFRAGVFTAGCAGCAADRDVYAATHQSTPVAKAVSR